MTLESSRIANRPNAIILVATAIVGLIVSALLDLPARRWVNGHVHNSELTDWSRMFRSGGYLPTWLIVTAGLLCVDTATTAGRWCRAAWRRAASLALSVVIGGIAVETAKLLFRRERPAMNEGAWYVFRRIADHPFSTGGLSMPSSHAAVSFSAAFALARLFPAARWVWIGFAIGTAVVRVLAGAHYLSDVYVAAFVGMGAAWAASALIDRRSRAALPHP